MGGEQHVFLVPGFFGFANLGELRYFGHVRSFLDDRFSMQPRPFRVHDVPTRPTASLVERAAFLAERIVTLAPSGPVHLIGHSSGGLDARLLAAPSAELPTGVDLHALRGRIRSIVTVATPHLGTPVASFFCTLYGQQLLRALSLASLAVIRRGRVSRAALVGLAGALAGRGQGGVIRQVYRDLLSELSDERRQQVDAFLTETGRDTSLLVQLRPEGIELMNALGRVPDDLPAGSVAVAARAPGAGHVLEAGLSASQQAAVAVFIQLHRLARPPVPLPLAPLHRDALSRGNPGLLADGANDGMVPVRSQVWREVLAVATADHLDIIGHFHHPDGDPPHHDWLATGSGFRRDAFERIWAEVARFVLDA